MTLDTKDIIYILAILISVVGIIGTIIGRTGAISWRLGALEQLVSSLREWMQSINKGDAPICAQHTEKFKDHDRRLERLEEPKTTARRKSRLS